MLIDTTHVTSNIQLMEAEDSLYWRMVCRHLQKEAQVSLPLLFLMYSNIVDCHWAKVFMLLSLK